MMLRGLVKTGALGNMNACMHSNTTVGPGCHISVQILCTILAKPLLRCAHDTTTTTSTNCFLADADFKLRRTRMRHIPCARRKNNTAPKPKESIYIATNTLQIFPFLTFCCFRTVLQTNTFDSNKSPAIAARDVGTQPFLLNCCVQLFTLANKHFMFVAHAVSQCVPERACPQHCGQTLNSEQRNKARKKKILHRKTSKTNAVLDTTTTNKFTLMGRTRARMQQFLLSMLGEIPKTAQNKRHQAHAHQWNEHAHITRTNSQNHNWHGLFCFGG